MPRQGDDTPAGATSSSGVRDHLWDGVYIGLEAGAASIRTFEPSVVPGLLQTGDYARETFRHGPIELDPDGVERLVEVRLARQKILTRDNRPRLWAVIDEAVIRRVANEALRLIAAYVRWIPEDDLTNVVVNAETGQLHSR